jgi:hypothetical protein
MPEVFSLLDDLVKAGKLARYGVSAKRSTKGLGDRASERRERSNHLQHLPPTPGTTLLQRSKKGASPQSYACRWQAGWAGCDKLFSTCRTKFDNAENFRGFPHMPGNDFTLSYARGSDRNTGAALIE